jgi:hypothetical protein
VAEIKPTNGRVLWFWPDVGLNPGGQPWDAHCAFVHLDGRINVGGFNPDGNPYRAKNVPIWNGEGAKPTVPHCEWMPYQKGQAAKTEALEADAAKAR